jgi:integrase/recombinase XerD
MMLLVLFGIILGAPTTWSMTIMTYNLKTCIDPYLDSFAQSFAAANYKAATITEYRKRIRRLGELMDVAGVDEQTSRTRQGQSASTALGANLPGI